jgi:KDO2-lipid IV(A) lauroyltransferase
MPKQRRLVARQVSHAFPDADPAWRRELAKDAFRSMGAAAAETVRLRHDSPRRWRARVSYDGLHYLDAARSGGRGVVVASAHIGAWEILPSLLALLGHPVSVVVRSVREQRLNALVAELRAAHGVRLVALDESPRVLGRLLRENGVVMMAADQRPRRVRRVAGKFLGRSAWNASGPATVSRVFGSPLLTAHVRWTADRRRHIVSVEPPVEMGSDAAVTDALGRRFERWIRANPSQWVWFHERWKDAPQAMDVLGPLAGSPDDDMRVRGVGGPEPHRRGFAVRGAGNRGHAGGAKPPRSGGVGAGSG